MELTCKWMAIYSQHGSQLYLHIGSGSLIIICKLM